MEKLLTIAIPTYNRANLLDQQLEWLSGAIQGFENECEILVSDNCSTDNTQDIIQKWQNKLSNFTFVNNRHSQNLGAIKNITYCLSSPNTKYVWAIGDDDIIQNKSLPYVIKQLKLYQNLSLLFLNFSGHNKLTGEAVHPPKIKSNRWFDADVEHPAVNGKAIFAHCFAKSVGAVIFLSATIYRTDMVKSALQIWPNAIDNWICLAYLSGYCAVHGSVIVTKEIFLQCIIGVSYWQKETDAAMLMQYKHIPEVILKLREVGYDQHFCRDMILQNGKEVNLKVFLGALKRWPVSAIKTVIPFVALLGISTFELIPITFNRLRIAEASHNSREEIMFNNENQSSNNYNLK